MKLRFGLAFAIAILASSAQTAVAQGTIMTWNVDGSERQALVFAPAPTTSAMRHPLVFGFHGHGGSMQGASQQMHIHALWPAAIVVYPQGLNSPGPIDPVGNKTGWQIEANQVDGNVGNRDLDFFDAMLATMKQKFTVDDRRIYTTGFSSGGVFSYLLWAERSKNIAAIGEVAGRLADSEHLTEPRALLAIAGRQDTTDPFAMQKDSIEKALVADNVFHWGLPCGQYCTFYLSISLTPVKTFIHPDAHVYPLWAPGEIMKFFKAHKQT